jgi:membrane protein YdbS with pleckstrin-like domain
MTFGETFAQSSVKGALTRGAVSWVLITPAVAAAKLWWSGAAAAVVCALGVVLYVAAAERYRRQRRPRSHPRA